MNLIKKAIPLVLLSLTLLSLVGCSGRPVHIKNVPYLYENAKGEGKQITAVSSGFQLLLFIPININDRQERAYALLQAKAGDGIITDVKIKESWKYAFVGTIYRTTMTATVYPKQSIKKPSSNIKNKLKMIENMEANGLITNDEYILKRKQLLQNWKL
ncbi:MAG: hypothetical protein ACI9RG_000592 [Sulfurimonas sp.]|jgi:hypothetical protein